MRYFATLGALVFAVLASAQFKTGLDATVGFSTYQEGQNSRITRESQTILQTEGDFQRYWTQLTGRPAHEAPRDVDWNTHHLIAIHLGLRQTGGYRVSVRSINRVHAGDLLVTWVEHQPARDAMVAQVQTSPFVLIRVPRTAGVFRFAKEFANAASGSIGGAPGTVTTLPSGVKIYHGQAPPPPPVVVVIVERVPYTTFYSGWTTNTDLLGVHVLTSDVEYSRFWSLASGVQASGSPGVDWSRERLVAISPGVGRGPVSITTAGRTESGEVIVRYRDSVGSGPQLASPLTILRLPVGGKLRVEPEVRIGRG
ncbi:MAG: hypothetical protein AMXMBFR81_11330 [Chthonomonas sp.]